MNLVALRSVRVMLTMGLVVVLASTMAVLRASGAFAAPTPTLTVTCTTGDQGVAAVDFSWANASNLGMVLISPSGMYDIRLTTSDRSGSFRVVALAYGPSAYAQAALYSKPDKSGNVTLIASGSTPEPGCTI